MRRCRSSLATRISPIAGSDTRRSLDIWGLRALGAEDARFEHGADAAAEAEGRAAAGQPRHLLGEAGGAGDRTAGGLVSEPLQHQAPQAGVQLGEAPVVDLPGRRPGSFVYLGIDQRVEQL